MKRQDRFAYAAICGAVVLATALPAFAAGYNVSDFQKIMKYAFTMCQWAGMVVGAIGIYRWVSGGKAHDASAQEGAAWVILTGLALVAIGTYLGTIDLPTM